MTRYLISWAFISVGWTLAMGQVLHLLRSRLLVDERRTTETFHQRESSR